MATSSEFLNEELPPNIVMKDYNTYYCECCSCVLVGSSCMKQHAVGKRHKKEMQRIGAVILPSQNEIIEADVKPMGTSSSTELPCGIIESKEKWNSFHCTYCKCDLGAGDLNLHVGGKRHTKKANQAAIDNFMNKRGGQNISPKTESTFSFEESNDSKSIRYDKVTKKDVDETASDTSVSIISTSETNTYVKSNPQTKSVKATLETNVFNESAAETNISVEVSSQIKPSEKLFPQTSVKISHKADTSEKLTHADALVKTTSQNDLEEMSQINESVKTNSKVNSSRVATHQMTPSTKVTPPNNSSIKTAEATASITVDSPQTNASVKDTPQTKIKAVSQVNASVKTTSQTNVSVKDAPQKKEKAIPEKKVSAKSTSQTSASVKALKAVPQTSVNDTPQQKASIKANAQTSISIKVASLPASTSLNEYFATVSTPVVGLNYVVETQIPHGQSTFHCKLCKVSGDTCMMKNHINATKHHLEYLRTVDPIKAAGVKALKETERNQKILEHVTELERTKGRGTILVKSAETKTNTDEENDEDEAEKTTHIMVKNIPNCASDDDTEGSAIQIVAQEFLTKDVIRNAQKKDPKTSKIIKEILDDVPKTSYIMHDGILYERRNGKYRVVVARTMKQAIYESYHFSLCKRTPGAVTYINDSYSWSGINEDIAKFAKQCYVCQIRKLRQLHVSDCDTIPILVRRERGKKASSTKRGFNDLTNEEIEDTQQGDPDIIKLIADIEKGLETNKYIVYANILYCLDEKGQYKVVVSPQMKKLIFEKNHSMLCWKSTERPPIINAITQIYFWQRVLEEVKLFAAKCKKCRINIPGKRIADQKISVPASAKISKKTTEKFHDEKSKDKPKEKTQKSLSKDKSKEKALEVPKEKPSKSSWDKTENLKPPIVEQDILSKDIIQDAQKKDLTTSKIIKLLMDGVPSSNYIIYEGILYQEKDGSYLTMVADKMKQAIYETCHYSLCSRYTSGSYQKHGPKYIKRHFSWPAMSQDIYIFVKNCHVCQVKTLRTKAFSHSFSERRRNNNVIISESGSAFNDLTDDEITTAQQKDPDILKILRQIDGGFYVSRYILYEDILYCQDGHGNYKVVITPEMKQTIYQNNHFLICWESTVWQSTVDTIAQVYLWPRIYEDIRDLMEHCQVCKREFPEQSYINPMASVNLVEQYPSEGSDPGYYSTLQQYQSNYPVQSEDPYVAENSAAYPYAAYSEYWNASPDEVVAYPTIGTGANYCESSILDASEQDYLLNSGKRSAEDDINEDSFDSYNQRKRHRLDDDFEYEYPRLQNDRLPLSSFEAPSPHPSVGSHSELSQPIEAESYSNTIGFTINNAEDAEVTLDIINSLVHIYLKYQLKKLHGPIQKLLQDPFKEEDDSNTTSLCENEVSDTSDVTNTNELFIRLPRLSKKAEVKQASISSVKTLNESFPLPSFGKSPHNKSTYASSAPTIFKTDIPCNVSANSSRKNMNVSFIEESDSLTMTGFPSQSRGTDDDDNIDGFPMITNPPYKVPSKWDDDDIDGKPLITESSLNTECTTDSIDSLSLKRKTCFGHAINSPIRSARDPSSHKPLKNEDDDIDGFPLGFRTINSLNKSQADLKSLPAASKPGGSSNKPERNLNDNKDTPFLKPDSTKIFKKPPDDWDKNANKEPQTIKSSSFTKPKSNLNESSDDQMSETKALSDKYPNWKKGGVQGGTSFYNSPLYNKANEGEASNSNNAPVIDLFKRYRRVQL